MKYKYSKKQIFGKRLSVPSNVLETVYDNNLSLKDYIEYDLIDKVPDTCLNESDKQLLEKFGLDKAKQIDWELLRFDKSYKEIIQSTSTSATNINEVLYEQIKYKYSPTEFTTKMKEYFKDKVFIEPGEDEVKIKFNHGTLTLKEMLLNWDTVKDKDLTYSLSKDIRNTDGIKNDELKEFVKKYSKLIPFIINEKDIYEFINEYRKSEDKLAYIKVFTDSLVEQTIPSFGKQERKFTIDELKEFFKYSSLEEYLKTKTRALLSSKKVVSELSTLPENYIFDIDIPFEIISTAPVLSFIGEYGLKNVVDFDNECGHFFTKNNCETLKLMYDMYLHYAGNETDPNKSIKTKSMHDEQGRFVDRPYNKDEFYEAMRRMIVFGPSDWNYREQAPDYREMTGEFKNRNKELFIDEDAPEEFKKVFYTKSILPSTIRENPKLIKYIKGKDLGSCFKTTDAIVVDLNGRSRHTKLYHYLDTRLEFDELMEFLIDYADVIETIYSDAIAKKNIYQIEYSEDDTLEDIKNKMDDTIRKILIREKTEYPRFIPDHLRNKYPNLFLSEDTPNSIKDILYKRQITNEMFITKPELIEKLQGIDVHVLFPYMKVKYLTETGNDYVNLLDIIIDLFEEETFEIMQLYGIYLEKIINDNKSLIVEFNKFTSKEDFLNEIDSRIYKLIIKGRIKYNEKLPLHFKNNYKELFLDEDVEQEIKNRFYNREFKIEDFEKYPELYEIFNKTNIACGLGLNCSWAIPLLSNKEITEENNKYKLNLIAEYNNVEDFYLKDEFVKYVDEIEDNLESVKLSNISRLLNKITNSRSIEIYEYRESIANRLLRTENPFELLIQLEDELTSNDLPIIAKIFKCFEILYPNFKELNFENASPNLKATNKKKKMISNDLVKSIIYSNNRIFKKFLELLAKYETIYDGIRNKKINTEFMDEESRNEIDDLRSLLSSIYNNSVKCKNGTELFEKTDDIEADILSLAFKISPNRGQDYNLADRIVDIYCSDLGIDSLEAAKLAITKTIDKVDGRNRQRSLNKYELKKGDFVKGIGSITYLKNILQNGVLSSELLGINLDDDFIPATVTLEMIDQVEGSFINTINKTRQRKNGPIWIVLKNDGRFLKTDDKLNINKLELYQIKDTKYGIRTGFASTEIDYMIMNEYDERVGLEIALNGFYIPVVNNSGELVFTQEKYDEIRNRMNGLKNYGDNNFIFSSRLVNNDTKRLVPKIEQSKIETQLKREKINALIKRALYDINIKVKYRITGKLTNSFAELIDTGSTGRVTNQPGNAAFDLILRLDREILNTPYRINELKQSILKYFDKQKEANLNEDFRLTDVFIDDKTLADINLKFDLKTNGQIYNTNTALLDRLHSVEKANPEKYKYVIANILLAKQILAEANVYKPAKFNKNQGGLGGVGIENWILQYGGSFEKAAESFLDASLGKSFEEFKNSYHIWDFGENPYSRKSYAHDDFINNLNEVGYEKMLTTLAAYVRSQQEERFNSR